MQPVYRILGVVAVTASLAMLAAVSQSNEKPDAKPSAATRSDDPAVARARKTVQMLDDIYKNAVVLITDKYVHDEDDFPAGSAAVALFEAISKKGWHQVRLIDATGQPYEEKNVARDDFEKAGIARLKAGDAIYEQVVEADGGRQYRAVTPIPVVMQKCVMCHAHYANAKKNETVGAISYSVPVE
ncbi:MAG: DUF3365 domain-containing protein [Pirellulales bacterium]|nr:DUF3365 domain-containing protein [Pirellulales bacterium]